MAQPTNATALVDLHPTLHNVHIDAKMYGAIGNGIADDTSALQAAIDAAQAVNGNGHVLIPRGHYRITDSLVINGRDIRISGATSNNPADELISTPPDVFGWQNSGVRLSADMAKPMIKRTSAAGTDRVVIIEDIGFKNYNAAGEGISLNSTTAGGIDRCWINAHKGITFTGNNFNTAVTNCRFREAITALGSIAISLQNHCQVYNCDINGFEQGIRAIGAGIAIHGGRIEVCATGITWGGGGFVSAGTMSGLTFEACDVGVDLIQAQATVLSGSTFLGSVTAPSGSSHVAIRTAECYGVTVVGCRDSGTHTVATVQVQANANRFMLTFISVQGISGFSFADRNEVTVINCYDVSTPFTELSGNMALTKAGSHQQFLENGTADAAAGAANTGRLYVRDNGSGKTQLCVRFNTGAVQVIATEP